VTARKAAAATARTPKAIPNSRRGMNLVSHDPMNEPGIVAAAKSAPVRKLIRRIRAYAIVPEEALTKTTARDAPVIIDGESWGKRSTRSGTMTNPPPAPMIVP
jgi:hypothetical protein